MDISCSTTDATNAPTIARNAHKLVATVVSLAHSFRMEDVSPVVEVARTVPANIIVMNVTLHTNSMKENVLIGSKGH